MEYVHALVAQSGDPVSRRTGDTSGGAGSGRTVSRADAGSTRIRFSRRKLLDLLVLRPRSDVRQQERLAGWTCPDGLPLVSLAERSASAKPHCGNRSAFFLPVYGGVS